MTLPVLPLLLGVLGVAVATFVLPVRGVNRRIRRAKQDALDALQAELAQRVADTVARAAEPEPGRLTDLLTLRAYVEALREWPFDNSMLIRFVLYLTIPLGSSVGGALVERVIDLLFD